LNHKVLELSTEQRDAYNCVVSYVQPTHNKQLLAIWGGEGGVGKSHVLRAAALYVQLQYGYNALVVTESPTAQQTSSKASQLNTSFTSVQCEAQKRKKYCRHGRQLLRQSERASQR